MVFFTLFLPCAGLPKGHDIKSVDRIEVIDLKRAPKLTYIGVGPGDTDLITIEAITAMSRADAFICSPDIKKRFGKYMGDRPVLFDIYDFSPPEVKKKNPGVSQDDLKKIVEERRTAMAESIKAELNKGKHVAILEYGDPTVWSGSEYISEHFNKDMFEIIPGLSSFNVASALLNRHTGCKGVREQWYLQHQEEFLKTNPCLRRLLKTVRH
jgi:precorrin-2 methylase